MTYRSVHSPGSTAMSVCWSCSVFFLCSQGLSIYSGTFDWLRKLCIADTVPSQRFFEVPWLRSLKSLQRLGLGTCHLGAAAKRLAPWLRHADLKMANLRRNAAQLQSATSRDYSFYQAALADKNLEHVTSILPYFFSLKSTLFGRKHATSFSPQVRSYLAYLGMVLAPFLAAKSGDSCCRMWRIDGCCNWELYIAGILISSKWGNPRDVVQASKHQSNPKHQ